jgi:hypothetical protein
MPGTGRLRSNEAKRGRESECLRRLVWGLFGVPTYCRFLVEAFARLLKSSASLTQ